MNRAQIIILVLFFALLAALGAVAYLLFWNSEESEAPVVEDVAQSTVEAVAKLLVLPKGEEPTVATVTDLEPLRGQPFFQNAKVGDKVLIYTASRKAILYDPVANKIVEVATLNVGEEPITTSTGRGSELELP